MFGLTKILLFGFASAGSDRQLERSYNEPVTYFRFSSARNHCFNRPALFSKKILPKGLEHSTGQTRSNAAGSWGIRSGAGAGGSPARCSYPCCSTEDMAMRNYDLTNFSRSSVGFEPFFSILNGASRRLENEGNFPPYDIIKKDEANYSIRLAVAGYSPSDLTITAQQNLLTVAGRKACEPGKQYLHEGITDTEFERQFSLADHVEVTGAGYDKGILEIDLHNEIPEAAKPRKISINVGSAQKRLS